MSTDAAPEIPHRTGVPELTALGKRLEILRIERGVSKQRLARHAGTSRQQLWRVMTGKSELTSSLRERLASALSVDSATLNTGSWPTIRSSLAGSASSTMPTMSLTVTDFLTDARHLESSLRTLPAGDGGRRLKRALLNAIEDLAVDSERALPIDYSDIRRRVLAGEL
jgi:transcriptional regulator with XRE-family HTH domain